MPRYAAESRAMRALGTFMLAAFVAGLVSGPLRTCVTHPGHGLPESTGDVAVGHLAEHMAAHQQTPPDDGVPHREHEGCSCLGQCSLEHPQYLPTTAVPVLAQAPMVPRALVAEHGRPLPQHDRLSLPLARPPPSVV